MATPNLTDRENPSLATRDGGNASAVIDDIIARFHEPHRREIAEMRPILDRLEQAEGFSELVGRLRRFGDELELHMFMEEMRLFPMMSQGGHVLIGGLIDDMEAEHAVHRRAAARLRALVDECCSTAQQSDLAARVNHLLDELAAHIVLEDEVLFPLFNSSAPGH